MDILVYIVCALAVFVVLYVPGRRIRFQSTPTDLVITWKGREKPAPVTLVGNEIVSDPPPLSWPYVRSMELICYGKYFHTIDGRCLRAGITPEEEQEARDAKFGPSTQLDLARGYQVATKGSRGSNKCAQCLKVGETWEGRHGSYYCRDCWSAPTHRCRNCGSTDTWQSSIDGHWRCHKAECQPCWCGHCNGTIGQHNEDARALYRAQCDNVIKTLANKGIIS